MTNIQSPKWLDRARQGSSYRRTFSPFKKHIHTPIRKMKKEFTLSELMNESSAGMESRRHTATTLLHTHLHVNYFRAMLQSLPTEYLELDTSRMTVLYFCVVGLDMLTGDVTCSLTTRMHPY